MVIFRTPAKVLRFFFPTPEEVFRYIINIETIGYKIWMIPVTRPKPRAREPDPLKCAVTDPDPI